MLETFGELKEVVMEYVRSDEVETKLPLFVKLAEADIQRKLSNVTSLFESAQLTIDSSSQYAEVIGVHTIKELYINGIELDRVPVVKTDSLHRCKPYEYAIEGKSRVKFYPNPDREYVADVIYMPMISPLLVGGTVADDSTNWLLQESPDIYLYGTLMQCSAYLASESLVTYKQLYDSAIKDFKATHNDTPKLRSLR